MTVESTVRALETYAGDVDRAVEGLGTLSHDGGARILAAIRDLKSDLSMIATEIEKGMASAPRRFVVEGLGEVEVVPSKKRTQWRLDELVPAVLARINDDPALRFDESGERVPDVELMARVAQKLRDCVGMSYGKVGGLKALGLDASEFCHEELDGKSVRLPARKG